MNTRIYVNSQLYPEYCNVPKETVMHEVVRVAKDLLNAIKELQGQELVQPGRYTSALKMLAEIFQEETINLDATLREEPQTSSSKTRP